MELRQLGNSDLHVSEISLGSWLTYGVGVERDQAQACVERAFEVGINFIDTANAYGRGAAESFLGEVLAGHAPVIHAFTVVESHLLAARAHVELGDRRAANAAVAKLFVAAAFKLLTSSFSR